MTDAIWLHYRKCRIPGTKNQDILASAAFPLTVPMKLSNDLNKVEFPFKFLPWRQSSRHCIVGCLVQFSPDQNISTNTVWITNEFCTTIHGSQRIYHTDSGEPLTFPLALL